MRTHRKNLFRLVLALASGRPVFTADYYAVDGVTGKVASFIDWNDAAHLFAQSTGASQCAVPSAEADLGGRLAATFDGVGVRYASNRAASQFQYLHGNAGAFVGGVYAPRSSTNGAFTWLLATSSASAAVGYVAYAQNTATNSGMLFKVGNGASVIAGSLTPVTFETPAVASGGRCLNTWFAGGNSPAAWAQRAKASAIASGNSTGNPSATDSASTLILGANASQTVFMNNRFAMLYMPPTNALTQFSAYTLATYGVAA